MRTSILLAALLVLLLVWDSEQSWVRKAKRFSSRPGPWSRRPVRKIYGGARRSFPGYVGKRSADDSPCPPGDDDDDEDGMDPAAAVQRLKKLELDCPKFAIDPSLGLSKDIVLQAFDAVDEDKDNNLDGKELDEFEATLDAFEVCEEKSGDEKETAPSPPLETLAEEDALVDQPFPR